MSRWGWPSRQPCNCPHENAALWSSAHPVAPDYNRSTPAGPLPTASPACPASPACRHAQMRPGAKGSAAPSSRGHAGNGSDHLVQTQCPFARGWHLGETAAEK